MLLFVQKVKNGERKYYALKDKKLRQRAKGAILLEMDFVFNSVSKLLFCKPQLSNSVKIQIRIDLNNPVTITIVNADMYMSKYCK